MYSTTSWCRHPGVHRFWDSRPARLGVSLSLGYWVAFCVLWHRVNNISRMQFRQQAMQPCFFLPQLACAVRVFNTFTSHMLAPSPIAPYPYLPIALGRQDNNTALGPLAVGLFAELTPDQAHDNSIHGFAHCRTSCTSLMVTHGPGDLAEVQLQNLPGKLLEQQLAAATPSHCTFIPICLTRLQPWPCH